MKNIKIISALFLTVFCLIPWHPARAAVCYAAISGAWGNGANWSGCSGTFGIPSATDDVYINSGVRIVLDSNVAVSKITVNGILDTSLSGNYAITTNSIYISSPGKFNQHGSMMTLTGTSGTLFTNHGMYNQQTSTVIVTSDANIEVISGLSKFNNLVLSPLLSNNRTYTFPGGQTTIYGNLTINPDAPSTKGLTVVAGGDTIIKGDTIISGAGSATGFFDTTINNYKLKSHSLDIESNGILDAHASNINLAGDWKNLGVFNAGTSRVIFTGPDTVQFFTGGTFYNLTITNPTSKEVNFYTGVIETQHEFRVIGYFDSIMKLRSHSPGVQWQLHQSRYNKVDYADIQDAGCYAIPLIHTTNSVDSGNNGTCWVF